MTEPTKGPWRLERPNKRLVEAGRVKYDPLSVMSPAGDCLASRRANTGPEDVANLTLMAAARDMRAALAAARPVLNSYIQDDPNIGTHGTELFALLGRVDAALAKGRVS